VQRVTAPPGCRGIDLQDGTRYNVDRNGVMRVQDHHAAAIRVGWYGQSGVMAGTERHVIGTRTGRWCRTCSPSRLWNKWNKHCPRCGADTVEETP
jgi:Zn finger protein HypA/HybF involved in hydrogenase expression